MKPIPGRMSLLSSESSGFAQMGMLAIPQGQILGSDVGTSSCSSKTGGMSGSGSSDPGIFGGSCCSLGGVVCLCEPPDCCPAFWGSLGEWIIYHASLLAESRKNCQSILYYFFRVDICLTWRLLGQNVWSSRLARRFPRLLGPGAQFLSPLASSKSPPLLNGTMRLSEEDRPKFPVNPLPSGPGKSESDELGSLPLWNCSIFKVPDATDSWTTIKQNEILPRHMDIGYIILVLKRGAMLQHNGEGELKKWFSTKRSLFKSLLWRAIKQSWLLYPNLQSFFFSQVSPGLTFLS